MKISLQCRSGEPADPPHGHDLGAHVLVELDGVHVPVEHAPLHPPHPHLRRLPRHCRQQHPPQPPPPPSRPHEDVLYVQPRLREESGVVREAQYETSHHYALSARRCKLRCLRVLHGGLQIDPPDDRGEEGGVAVFGKGGMGELENDDGEGEEGGKRGGGEERVGEGGLGGGEKVGQQLELRHLPDEAVDVGHVASVGKPDSSPDAGGRGGRHCGGG
ncbi:unnamed protein product [Musa hybrid cultivar]